MLTIRRMTKEDIPDMVNIQVRSWQIAYRGIVDDSYLDSIDIEEKISKREQDYLETEFIVAEEDSKIVGFCRYTDNNQFSPFMSDIDCELIALYVAPSLKRKGIGKKLFEYTKNDLINRERESMIIWCLKDNEPSKKFYQKMGGKIVAEKAVDMGGKTYYEVGFAYKIWSYREIDSPNQGQM
ncbi:GNAT family N-acetyltransferase [Drancourtella massiliensis]|uniref:GNAT family N-acetyltransferase n=1 Tax=Drancourtella massiliensis TaxID=1632013 RepID=A0ABS2EK98_9FIRM|nr:GNAT family N-acetyltransferase [Drancourtella massiliensis]MBM6745505.1 GNAT family N-acetyltransferase [Drancourtella massiliensis]